MRLRSDAVGTRRYLAALLVPLALLGACGDDDDAATGGDDGSESAEGEEANDIVVFGAADDGTLVELDVDSTFDVALEQCIGCGYAWSVVTEPDESMVVLDSEADIGGPEEVEGGDPVAGGMGEHVFHFEVVGPGTTTLELGSFPPGEQPAEKTFTLTVEAS